MKNKLLPQFCVGRLSCLDRLCKQVVATAALLTSMAGLHAQISVGGSGSSGTLTFDTLPAAAEFATGILGTGAATFPDPAAMDAGAQTVDAATVTAQLTTSATQPPGTFASGMRYNTAGLYLQSRPTTGGINGAGIMKATVVNNSGGDLMQVTISYDYALFNIVAEEVPGFRVFYSFTGAPGSWTLIPALSGNETPGNHSDTLGALVWPAGGTMYLLWADDNDDGASDYGQTIDNMIISGISTTVTPITITDDPDSLVVDERAPASFTVAATGSPQFYHWLSNGVAIPGANSATYSLPSAPYSANGAVFTCVVSNLLGGVTSAGATLTVIGDTTPPTLLSAHASTNGLDIVLTFSEPINLGYTDPGNFLIFETDLGVGAAFSPFGAVFNSNVVTLTLNAPLTEGVNYSMQIYDVYDTSLAVPDPGNLIAPYGAATNYLVRRNLLLVDFDGPNNTWSWTAETNLFDTGWETVGYDDALWPTGPGALGVNTDANVNAIPIRTATAYPTPGNSAPQFFRRHFFLPAGVTGTTLTMRHMFEDGAVVYINGQEAGRYNVAAGTLSVTTRAIANATEPTPVSPALPLPTTNLVAGDNVIAVVVIQNGGTSSDSIMALELVANIGTYAAGPPSIVTPPASLTVNEGGTANFSVTADGALPLTYHWSRNGVPIVGAHNASYSITGVLPSDAGNYSVIVSNSISTATSSDAVLTVTADTVNPALISALGSVDLNTVTVTLYDQGGFNLADLQNPSNYSVGLTAGGGALGIASAVAAASGTNVVVTLTTASPRLQGQNYTVGVTVTDRSAAANPTTPASRPVQATIVLFGYNQVWRYDESGLDLGETWKDVGYNDGSWLSGAGFLTFETSVGPLTLFTNLAGGNGSNTVLNLTNQTLAGIDGTNITFYFRTTLNNLPFNPNAPGNVIRATSYFDDGGVIYVNGSEQVRFNLTNTPGVANYTNLAIAGSAEAAGGLVTSNLTGFAQANNVIAAEVHQNTLGSSDIAWGMQLEALVTTFVPGCGPLSIVDNGNGTVTITWSGTGTLQSSTDISNPLNWANVGGASSPHVTASAGAPRFFRLTCP